MIRTATVAMLLVIKELVSTDLSVHATYASSDNEPHLHHENMQHILYLLGVGTVMQFRPVANYGTWNSKVSSKVKLGQMIGSGGGLSASVRSRLSNTL